MNLTFKNTIHCIALHLIDDDGAGGGSGSDGSGGNKITQINKWTRTTHAINRFVLIFHFNHYLIQFLCLYNGVA